MKIIQEAENIVRLTEKVCASIRVLLLDKYLFQFINDSIHKISEMKF